MSAIGRTPPHSTRTGRAKRNTRTDRAQSEYEHRAGPPAHTNRTPRAARNQDARRIKKKYSLARTRRRQVHEYVEQWSSFTSKEQLHHFTHLSIAKKISLLTQINTHEQERIIKSISSATVQSIVQACNPDDLVHIMRRVRPTLRTLLWNALPAKRREETQALLTYKRTNAAGVMTSRYIAVQNDITVKAAIDYLRKIGQRAETIYYIYVVSKEGMLEGVISLRDLLMAKNNEKIFKVMVTDIVSVKSDTDQEDAAKLLSSYNFIALPVCDHQQRIIGIITFDDVIDVLRDEQTEDVYKMSAVTASTGQYLTTAVGSLVLRRVPWLLLLLLFGTVTTNIINSFQSLILASTFVIWFIPVITQTGGNSGAQSSTLMIRGLAMGEIHWRDIWRVIGKEIMVGMLLGIVLGASLLLRGIFLPPQISMYSAVAVSIALSLVVLISSLIGALFPLIIYKCGFDPTVMAGPLMATVIDAVGITLYFLILQFFLL